MTTPSAQHASFTIDRVFDAPVALVYAEIGRAHV